ncbi:nitrilase-related carbon-nitrogen hydrolase [Haliangium ochraceum]|uniref:Nitrilase/cyanide hydratase and apolipoprotein N-acyltransferase n=1 Tax=Haliangium ochraceum (strain DSM 14365 / JCM 11303 / SMP-2) TaxID=502025 RepID=D0LV74_HALO1|nr:nitrilase-related carbon-nitrogen hydrolase [Haliangium ochraceum]ACY15915.1 Nitrilase/cyanide hydratase and apolipoprotein N- acyltransferase [Haliangium ochraceum DSM 14365]
MSTDARPASALRCALTETRNVFPMPASLGDLAALDGRMDEIRTANVTHHLELCAIAASRGVQVLGMGELFPAPYFALHCDPRWRELAEDARTGPTVTALRVAARTHKMVLVAPIYERCADSGKCFNTAVVIDQDGEILGSYKKTHIPQGTNEQASFEETYYYERSDGRLLSSPANVSDNAFFPVFQTALGRIAVAICYDRHFEGVMRTLAEQGAELVLSPAVTFGAKSERMWPLEFAVDAARHGLFIGGSNRRGSEPPWNQPYFGGSHFVGPGGACENLSDHDELIIADLDMDELRRPDPSGWNLPRDRRPDIYAPLVQASEDDADDSSEAG